ncbi:MAG: VRR-NUC domain-containing protein [Saccharospirillum sp.]
MAAAPPPDLPVGYYLNNFRALLNTVNDRYDDLLTDTERDFITRFSQLETPAARLLVRCYTRKGPRFRLSKLQYPEIPDTRAAVNTLAQADLIDPLPLLSAEDVARLLTLPELRRLDWVTDKKAGKNQLLDALAAQTERRTATEWGLDEPVIEPRHWDALRCLQLLYFGNEQQSLTDFVLADLGLFRYEAYALSRHSRAYQQRIELDQHLALNDLRTQAEQSEQAGDVEALLAVAGPLLATDWYPAAGRRYQRLANRIGFRLEQWQQWATALRLYQSNSQPPARERQCRIHYKQGDYHTCRALLDQMKSAPKDSSETRFYHRFQPKVARKLGLAVDAEPPVALVEIRQRWVRGELGVECQACAQLDQTWWLENLLPLGIFGLIHWPLVFADVPGAFHHPFQQGPSDLYHPEFLQRRGTSRSQLAEDITAERARERIETTWQAKAGVLNPFVHWPALELGLVLRCFERVPWSHWQVIFNHLWLDLKRHRSGFPDLFQITETGYRWIEIKGPGDRLQDNQRDWLQVFAEADIPAEVWYIDYD